ncbi:MAG: ATP-grasp domain-containing protein [Firmicutes bacterium]|nr:ATP-grasp domain-containing protein [Bacillota bacterium]
MKKILILNGTISEIPIIKKAQAMGFYVVTSGNMPDLPGHKVADEYIPEDYSDYKAILELVKENGIEGIISCANDFGVITSAYVAEQMGWKGHDTFKNAVMMHRKNEFKDYFLANGLPTPFYKTFGSADEAKSYCAVCEYPIIVKAADLTGGKGIHRADNKAEADKAIDTAFEMSRTKQVLIEQYMEGVQQSIVVFLINKKIVATSSSNVYCMKNPYLVQAETYPAENFDAVKDRLHEVIHKMAELLDLADGILSFQYIVKDGKPYVIDMMRRCFGNETLQLSVLRTGFPFEEAYIMAALNMPLDGLECKGPQVDFCGHYGIMADTDGILKGWSIPDDIRARTFKTLVNIPDGGIVHNHLNEKIAHIYFTYEDMQTMNSEILHYNDRVVVEMEEQ